MCVLVCPSHVKFNLRDIGHVFFYYFPTLVAQVPVGLTHTIQTDIVIVTSLLRENDVATPFWHINDVINWCSGKARGQVINLHGIDLILHKHSYFNTLCVPNGFGEKQKYRILFILYDLSSHMLLDMYIRWLLDYSISHSLVNVRCCLPLGLLPLNLANILEYSGELAKQ